MPQIIEFLKQFEWALFNVVLFILFIICLVEVLDKHIPVKAAIKKLFERIFPSIKL